jgi:hypothetical protein
MPLVAIEGIVENGTIRLRENVSLPQNTRVLVVIDGFAAAGAYPPLHVRSPRLARPEQLRDFRKQVLEVRGDAGL